MSIPHTIDNEGIGGGPFLTMSISASGSFTQDDIDRNTTACKISGNNEVSKGEAWEKLFGKVVWVSSELVSGTTRPIHCAVQARGVARFSYVAPAPEVNKMVELDGEGRVRNVTSGAYLPVGGHLARGQVIAVDTENKTCDIWLG